MSTQASSPTKRSTLVNCEKYIGLDVHQSTISVAVRDSKGKLVMESILETKASTILEFCGATRHCMGHLRRRNLGGLALRSPQASCRPSGGLQSTQERSAQTREQK